MAIKIVSGGKVKFQICANWQLASQLSLTQAGCRDAKEVPGHFIMRSQELPTLS